MVLEYAMASLGAKRIFGLVSAGTSTLQKVGFFVCFDVPKKTLKFYFRTQKNILLLPLRCASITCNAILGYLRPNSKKAVENHSQTIADGYESAESSGESEASNEPEASNESEASEPEASKEPESSKEPETLDALTLLTNGNADAKEVAKQTKAILTTSLESVLKLENWRDKMKERYLEINTTVENIPEDEKFQSLKVEKELYNGLHATWSYWKALKVKREKLGEDFDKNARRFFTKVIPKAKKVDTKFLKDISKQKSFIQNLVESDFLTASAESFEQNLKLLCRVNTFVPNIVKDFEVVKGAIKRIADENDALRSQMEGVHEKFEEVFASSALLREEVVKLSSQFKNMVSLERKLDELKLQLEDTRELLLRAECDRDDMQCKLEVLKKMIKEEEDFLDHGFHKSNRSLRSPPIETNKKIN